MVAIVIPVYNDCLTINENISLDRALELFHSHTIVFLAPAPLDITVYSRIANEKHNEYRVQFFPQNFFKSIEGYNSLMLNHDFYSQFIEFEFILIYQLDAFVFSDELTFWCARGYDYIGAPWIIKENDRFKIEKFAGNGGFSLRKVSAFKKTLEIKKRIVLNPFQVLLEYTHLGFKEFLMKIPLIIARIFGYKNSTTFFINSNSQKEDIFWAYYAPIINKKFKSSIGIDAICFAFEKYPSYLYKLNNYSLPFGCHAWTKHETEFWRMFIPSPKY